MMVYDTCPKCGEIDIEHDDLIIDDGLYTGCFIFKCPKCDHEWDRDPDDYIDTDAEWERMKEEGDG